MSVTVKAALDALRHDAGIWGEVSQVTGQAAGQAAALTLSEADLSWASAVTGLLDTYAALHAKVIGLLDEATDVYRDVSTTLEDVRDAYQGSDAAAVRRLAGVWDVRER